MPKSPSDQAAAADALPMSEVTIPLTIYPALSVPEVQQVHALAARTGVPVPNTVGLLIRSGLERALASETLPLAG